MTGPVRKIRKVETAKGGDFDDQLWPINCAIVILAGFIVGIVTAKSDFHDHRLFFNGWVHLVWVAVVMGALFWVAFWLEGKMLRRLRLCILISLLVNLWILMYAGNEYLTYLLAQRDSDSQRVDESYEEITVPDYYFEQIEEPEQQQSFEEPIETAAPVPLEPEAIKQEASEPEVPTTADPPEEPEIPQRQQPNPSVMRRAELSAPRRADAAAGAQISRQEFKHTPRPNEPILEPRVQTQARQAVAVPKANIAPQQRHQAEVRIDQRQTFEDLSSSRVQPVQVAMARRATQQARVPDTPATPSPTRPVRRAAETPRTDAAAPQPVRMAQRSQQAEPTPTPRSFAQRQTDAPAIVRPAAEPIPEPNTPQPAAQVAVQTRRAHESPQRAEAPRATPRRPIAQLQPPRQAAPRAEAVAATRPRNSAQPSPPTVQASRAVSAPSAQSPVRIAQTSVEASVRPAGRALPTVTRSTQLPSTLAARRDATSQQDPTGADAAAARPSSLARSSQGAALPSSALPSAAPAASMAASAGSTPPSRFSAAASAALHREAASPAPGRGQAAAGTADFAVGSAQIVVRKGQPRGSGFGQPSATANSTLPRIARAARPSPSIAASGVAQAAAADSGSVASAAKGPSTPSFNIRGSAARRGGVVREMTAQTATGSGPAGSSGTPGPVGVAAESRVTRYESIDAAISGSGTPRPGRTNGGAPSPSATASALAMASGAPAGGTASQAPPLQAQLSGPRRQAAGLPGGLESQPASGALASLVDEGAPLANAVARRGIASASQPGGSDLSAQRSTTLRRSARGIDLPALAVPMEDSLQSGAAGVATTDGGLPSTLPSGLTATIRHAAADLTIGQTTADSAASESSHGSAMLAAMAGRARTDGEGLPMPVIAATPRINRSSITQPAITAALP